MIVLNGVVPIDSEFILSVNYAERSLTEERLIFQQSFPTLPSNNEHNNNNNYNDLTHNNHNNNTDHNTDNSNNNNNNSSQNDNSQSNNSTIDSIDSYISLSTTDNSIFNFDHQNTQQIFETSSSTDELSTTSTSIHTEQISTHPNHILKVTLRGIPSNIDIMSFSFLNSFGIVLDGRIVEDTLNLYSPDGSSRLTSIHTGVITFTILTHSPESAENLLLLNGSIGSLTGQTFLFHMFSASL